jgi:hypothetical protein
VVEKWSADLVATVGRTPGSEPATVAVGELGSNVDNFEEVVSDVTVEADEVPPRVGLTAGNAGEACRLALWIFRLGWHRLWRCGAAS